MFSTAALADLGSGPATYQHLHAALKDEVIVLRADHVGRVGGEMSWTYRLWPVRWRNTDPPDYIDPDLQLGIWPD